MTKKQLSEGWKFWPIFSLGMYRKWHSQNWKILGNFPRKPKSIESQVLVNMIKRRLLRIFNVEKIHFVKRLICCHPDYSSENPSLFIRKLSLKICWDCFHKKFVQKISTNFSHSKLSNLMFSERRLGSGTLRWHQEMTTILWKCDDLKIEWTKWN